MNDPRDSLSGFSVPMIADTLLGGQPGSRFSASQKLARFLSRHGSSRGRGSDRRGPERLLPHRFTHEFPRRALFDMEPDDGLKLVGDEVEFRGDRAVCLSQRLVGAEANGGGQAVRAEHPRIKRDRLWVMRVPQVLPEGPGFGSRLGINGYAVARS